MSSEQPKEKPAQTSMSNNLEQTVATIVKIKPGSSSEKGLMFRLPADKQGMTLSELIDYAMTRDDSRKEERIVGRLKTEMEKSDYGLAVNGKVAKKDDDLGDYMTSKKLEDGTTYNEIEVVIATHQEGGFYRI